MGFLSRFEGKVEDTFEGAADRMFDAPISPVQIAKMAEKQMKREKMVGAGKQYAPTLYTVLVNVDDDRRLFGYYPTLAGETETYLNAKAMEYGLVMDGQPLVRFIPDPGLRSGKFRVIAEPVASSVVARLRHDEMQRYHSAVAPSFGAGAPAQAGYAGAAAQQRGGFAQEPSNAYGMPQARAGQPQGQFPGASPFPQQVAQRPVQQGQQVARMGNVAAAGGAWGANRAPQGFAAPGVQASQGAFASPMSGANAGMQPGMAASQAAGRSVAAGASAAANGAGRGNVQAGNAMGGAAAAGMGVAAGMGAAAAAGRGGGASYGAQGSAFGTSSATMVASPAAVQVRPVQLIDASDNTQFTITGTRASLGRESKNDVSLKDINASRCHAELYYDADQGSWFIVDLGSTNGTFLNGDRVTKTRVEDGDCLTIGITNLIFVQA